jgi:hypothetical protein
VVVIEQALAVIAILATLVAASGPAKADNLTCSMPTPATMHIELTRDPMRFSAEVGLLS